MVKAAVVELPVQPDGLPIVIHCEVFVRRNARAMIDLVAGLRERGPYQRIKYAVVVLEHSWKLELVRGFYNGEDLNAQLRSAPAEIVETDILSGHTYAALPHPLADLMLLFSAPSAEIEQLYHAVEEAGLTIVRMKISALGALEMLYRKGLEGCHGDLLYVDRNSYCLVQQVVNAVGQEQVDLWSSIRFASRRPGEALEQMASALRSRDNPEAPVTLLAESDLAEEVRALGAGLTFNLPVQQLHFDLFSSCVG